MKFGDIRIKDIVTVARYNTNMKSWRAKERKNHFIGIKLAGSALHDFGYKKFVLSGNSVYFFNQRDNYDVTVYEPGESFSVHFTTDGDIDCDSFCIPITNTSEILAILRKAENARNEKDSLTLYSLTYRLCAELEKLYSKPYTSRDKRIIAAKEYIDLHFAEDGALERAVRESALTARRFGDLFKSAVGTTPNRYVVLRRVERAKELLMLEGISVGEVAALCGFSDVYYFSKVFKSETGISPSRWRREV